MNETPEMTSMGMKRGDMYPSDGAEAPASEKDYKNEVCYPCLHADGEMAKTLGAESLEDGEYVQQTVIWKVRKTTVEHDGKKDYTLDLDLVKASDPKEISEDEVGETDEDEANEPEGEDDDEGNEPSPGLAFILAGKGRD